MIREILQYIWAQFAFKLGGTNFPTHNNYLPYNIVLTHHAYGHENISYLLKLHLAYLPNFFPFEPEY